MKRKKVKREKKSTLLRVEERRFALKEALTGP